MKTFSCRSLALALTLGIMPGVGMANTLTVSPTSVSVPAPGQAAAVTVRSGNSGTAHGQVRVYKSTPVGGGEQLSPTDDVVVSPPAFRLASNQEATFRLVRRSNAPVQGRECYRILIDQLPEATGSDVAVSFTIRHSVPLCFVAGGN